MKKDGQDWLFTFGNVERILNSSSTIYVEDEAQHGVEMTNELYEEISSIVSTANHKSLRTLGIARKRLFPNEVEEHLEGGGDEVYPVEQSGLTFLGIVALKDPLRKDVKEAVRVMRGAGITVRMVTGDTRDTAVAIARECGILHDHRVTNAVALGDEFYKAVGGLAHLCKNCEKKGNTHRIDMEERKESDKKLCPTCGEELQATAGDMDAFKKIEPNLRVIASCRPIDKYLLVAALKYM